MQGDHGSARQTPNAGNGHLMPVFADSCTGRRYTSASHVLRLQMYTVLSVSRDTGLLLRRKDFLGMHGFRVLSPRSPDQAPLLAMQQPVDAVVIGHSLERASRAALVEAIRRSSPKCVILFVYTSAETQDEPLADASLDVTNGPEPLLAELQERLPRHPA
jgi:hypothetical protein